MADGDLRCPSGSYNDIRLGFNPNCKTCPAGFFCDQDQPISDSYSGDPQLCPSGHYCPAGTKLETDAVECEAGYMCPTGSVHQILCPQGTFSSTRSESCQDCPAGQFCDPFETALVISPVESGKACPTGHFCPVKTASQFENPCPAGKYKTSTGGADISSCDPCSAGNYCLNIGQSSDSGQCYAGYICKSDSIRPDPQEKFDENAESYICPRGGHCPDEGCTAGDACKINCSAGSFNDKYGSIEPETCQECENTCLTDGLTQDGNCAAGDECIGNNVIPCPAGHYCPADRDSGRGIPCPPGTYNFETGKQLLTDCLRQGFNLYKS